MCMVLYINYTSIKLMAKKPIVYRSNNTRQKHVNNLLFIGKGSEKVTTKQNKNLHTARIENRKAKGVFLLPTLANF